LKQTGSDIADTLLAYLDADAPRDVRDVMRLSALDWAACGIAGARDGTFANWASTLTSQGSATRFDGALGDAAQVALVNGTLSHALDYDDTHFAHIGHPSVVVLSAALAVAETRGATLNQMLAAALAGAEASIAVGLWLGREHYQIGFHQTATAGTFGATIAAAHLMGLDRGQTTHAIGLAATMASGLKAQFGTMGKPLNAGLSARAGVEAASWALTGMTSSLSALDGPLGYGATHHGTAEPVEFAWRMGNVSHKFHACCHGLHATLEAVRGVALAHAERVTVYTHPRWLSVCNQAAPDTGLGAKFSYAHVLAMAAHGFDTGDIAAFSDTCARDPALVAFRNRVQVLGDADLSEMQARVDVDGDVHAHDLSAALPFQQRQTRIQEKARALVGARADDLWQPIQTDDLTGFAQLLMS